MPRRTVPIIEMAAHAVERRQGVVLIVEIVIGQAGPRETNILFDASGAEQTVLLSIENCRPGRIPTRHVPSDSYARRCESSVRAESTWT